MHYPVFYSPGLKNYEDEGNKQHFARDVSYTCDRHIPLDRIRISDWLHADYDCQWNIFINGYLCAYTQTSLRLILKELS